MMTKRIKIIAAIVVVLTIIGGRWALMPRFDPAGSQTLWKEYPEKYYPDRAGTVRVKDYKSPEACRYAQQEELMSKHNVGNGILYYCT